MSTHDPSAPSAASPDAGADTSDAPHDAPHDAPLPDPVDEAERERIQALVSEGVASSRARVKALFDRGGF